MAVLDAPVRRTMRGSLEGEEGFGAVLVMLGLAVVLVAVGIAVVDVSVVVASRSRAQVAADLAALGALTAAAEPPHAVAAGIAAANGARLVGCDCDEMSAEVQVERSVQLPMLGRSVTIPAQARATIPTEPLFPEPAPHPARNQTGGDPAAMIQALLTDPRLELTPEARADLARGALDPRLVSLLFEVVHRHSVAVSVFKTGHSRYVAGTTVVSKHAEGRAVDVYMVDGEPVSPGHAPSRLLVSWLATKRKSNRPSEVGSPFRTFDPLPGFFSNRAHHDHIHIAVG